jgi:hypothetical protein
LRLVFQQSRPPSTARKATAEEALISHTDVGTISVRAKSARDARLVRANQAGAH